VVDHKVEFLVRELMRFKMGLSGLAKQCIWRVVMLWCILGDLCLLLVMLHNVERMLALFLIQCCLRLEVWNLVSSCTVTLRLLVSEKEVPDFSTLL